jgi:hypothetical protein
MQLGRIAEPELMLDLTGQNVSERRLKREGFCFVYLALSAKKGLRVSAKLP